MEKHTPLTANVRCTNCKFACVDKKFSTRSWEAIECTNRKSESFKAILNQTPLAGNLKYIAHPGCPDGVEVAR
jgi:hypothetical protein